jgi:hypothetical protein
MKKHSKSLIRCLLGAAVLTLAGCGYFTEKLTAKPELLELVNKSDARSRMHTLDVTSVELNCSADKKVVGEFTFVYLDGRKPVTVAGDTPCAQSGKLARWTLNELATRADYTPELLTGEVDRLLVKSKLTPPAGSSYDHELGTALMKRYQTVLPADWRTIVISCDGAGEKYDYAVYNDDKKIDSGTLKSTCAASNQNFAASLIPAPTPAATRSLLVRRFNHAQPAALQAAFSELLDGRLPATKF